MSIKSNLENIYSIYKLFNCVKFFVFVEFADVKYLIKLDV